MERQISFEEMPDMIAKISSKLESIESLLREHHQNPAMVDEDLILGVKETAEFLGLSIQTIYSKVSRGDLPFMKRSKKLYFSKLELMDYLKQGKRVSNSEIERLAGQLAKSI